MTGTTPAPSAAAITAYLDASPWVRELGPEPRWSLGRREVEVRPDADPDALVAVLAAIGHAEGRGSGDVVRSVDRSRGSRRPPPVAA